MTLATTKSPLSDPQARNLIALAERFDQLAAKPELSAWVHSGYHGTRTNTLDSLVKLGLANRRLSGWYGYEYRITDEGIALLNSMGD